MRKWPDRKDKSPCKKASLAHSIFHRGTRLVEEVWKWSDYAQACRILACYSKYLPSNLEILESQAKAGDNIPSKIQQKPNQTKRQYPKQKNNKEHSFFKNKSNNKQTYKYKKTTFKNCKTKKSNRSFIVLIFFSLQSSSSGGMRIFQL